MRKRGLVVEEEMLGGLNEDGPREATPVGLESRLHSWSDCADAGAALAGQTHSLRFAPATEGAGAGS